MTPLSFDYPISVAILYYAGVGGDMEDGIECARGIAQALEEQGHQVHLVQVDERNWLKTVRTPGEVIFNLVEDDNWELYTKVGLKLEQLGRAQVGHDIRVFKYITKKARVKRRMQALGISTPAFRILNRSSSLTVRGLEYPLIVKPSGQHAGIGISQDSVVIDQDELTERVKYLFKYFPGEVVVEEFIDGREIHITILGNNRRLIALPTTEIEFTGEFADNWDVYTYNAKWEKNTWEYWQARVFSPARLSKKDTQKLEKLALKAYRSFDCKDIVRMDIRFNEKNHKAYIVDVNMSPSLNKYDNQDATLASVLALGWTYEEFIETLIAITYKRVYGRLPDRTRTRQFLLALPAGRQASPTI